MATEHHTKGKTVKTTKQNLHRIVAALGLALTLPHCAAASITITDTVNGVKVPVAIVNTTGGIVETGSLHPATRYVRTDNGKVFYTTAIGTMTSNATVQLRTTWNPAAEWVVRCGSQVYSSSISANPRSVWIRGVFVGGGVSSGDLTGSAYPTPEIAVMTSAKPGNSTEWGAEHVLQPNRITKMPGVSRCPPGPATVGLQTQTRFSQRIAGVHEWVDIFNLVTKVQANIIIKPSTSITARPETYNVTHPVGKTIYPLSPPIKITMEDGSPINQNLVALSVSQNSGDAELYVDPGTGAFVRLTPQPSTGIVRADGSLHIGVLGRVAGRRTGNILINAALK